MWIFTDIGFFSVVAHRDTSGALLVRARSRRDLEALQERHLPDMEIIENAGTDYRFRAIVARDEWEHAAAAMTAGIDYPNFKSAVAERQGHDRARVYHKVWSVMLGLQHQG